MYKENERPEDWSIKCGNDKFLGSLVPWSAVFPTPVFICNLLYASLLKIYLFQKIFVVLDDGAVRVWRNYAGNTDEKLELVTAWQALNGMIPSTRGMDLNNLLMIQTF